MLNNTPDKFYRYEIRTYVPISDDYRVSSLFSDTKLVLMEFNLHKETPKGYWIGYGNLTEGYRSSSTWVSKTSKKRYAYPTKEEALNNFVKRMMRRKQILERQLDSCIIGLNQANEIFEKEIS